jgi:hypothetical protein
VSLLSMQECTIAGEENMYLSSSAPAIHAHWAPALHDFAAFLVQCAADLVGQHILMSHWPGPRHDIMPPSPACRHKLAPYITL